ncbi:MAG: T9SS type A sorting domain-containing protein, partial [Flavobacteriaceae bacterium]|nr:T9SS type A sorting domain-containing protein [Flavobacteriaceae bacterium]
VSEGNDQYSILYTTEEVPERLTISITNMLGQNVMSYRLDNEGSGYSYDLDMSYAASGVYIVRLEGKNVSLAKRLIVN